MLKILRGGLKKGPVIPECFYRESSLKALVLDSRLRGNDNFLYKDGDLELLYFF